MDSSVYPDINYATEISHKSTSVPCRLNYEKIVEPEAEKDEENEQKTPEKRDRERIAAHSTYAQEKLETLDEKIMNKTQALQAMKQSQKPDPKVSSDLYE